MIDGFSQKSFGNTAYDRWISEKSFAMATLDYVASRRTNIAMGVAFPINSL